MKEHPSGMPETVSDNQFVSFEAFKALSGQYCDFCKKLRFFIKGAFTVQEEALALEIIAEFLDRKEKELQELVGKVSEEARSRGPDPKPDPVEVLLGRSLMQSEDYQVLQQITEIRKAGGPRWEMLQAIIKDTFPPGPAGK